jgi:hypothetical protein
MIVQDLHQTYTPCFRRTGFVGAPDPEARELPSSRGDIR